MSTIVFIISDFSIASFNTLSIFPRLCLMTFSVWGFRVWFCHPFYFSPPDWLHLQLKLLWWACSGVIESLYRALCSLAFVAQAVPNWYCFKSSTSGFSDYGFIESDWKLTCTFYCEIFLSLLSKYQDGDCLTPLVSRLFVTHLLPACNSLESHSHGVACGIFTWNTLDLIFPLLQFYC